MASLEPNRCSAYSKDLRCRIIWQTEGLDKNCEQVANTLGIDKSTVSRTRQRWLTHGTLKKKTYPKASASRKLTQPAQLLLLNLVIDRPGILLREMQKELSDMLMLEVDTSTICRFLHSSGLTRQKLCYVALQRDELLRQKFTIDVSLYESNMFIFVDETGADQRNILRKSGYSIRGKPLQKKTLLVRGERVSAVAIISVNGLLDVFVTKGTVDGDKFQDFTRKYLLPQLMPYNGINPHSIVVLDNCSIHHVQGIVTTIEQAGAMVHFLPPYSPLQSY
jgi:transposase